MDAGTLSLFINGELREGCTHVDVRGVGPLYAAAEAGTLQHGTIRANFKAEWPPGITP